MLSNFTKVLHNVKETIQTNVSNVKDVIEKNVIDPIAKNLQHRPTLGKIQFNERELEEMKLISQGGYAYIFQVRDTRTQEIFALKKMICQSNERLKTARNEISILKSVPSHPNLLKYYDSQIVKVSDGHHAFLLLEYCEEGTLFDLMVKFEKSKLNEKQIVFIMREVCQGVKALHSLDPPVIHRDLKVENILLHNKKFKLCDFGSCTSKVVDFSQISQREYAFYEEEYDKNTTLIYRPPEMCDPYQKFVVNDRVDVWMLGCILYTLCFYKQPFQEESSKLSIVNGAFTFPKDHAYPEKLIDTIRIMLTPNPINRPSIFELCDIFADYFSIETITLNVEAQKIKDEALKHELEMKGFAEQKRRKKHDEDIPIEELMNVQMKIQQKQKKKNKDGDFTEWSETKYPQMQGNRGVSNTSNGDDWGNFTEAKPDNTESGTFHFSEFQNEGAQKQANQEWGDFDFGSANNGAEQPANNEQQWGFGHWETPAVSSDARQKEENNNVDLLGCFGKIKQNISKEKKAKF